ncbi:MAG: carboxyl transferase domain-containing protein [Lachnospiraceae bacterium]|nr:carboxyl transferase domain-containing protein [Lachnospiraceae bacterium]
MSDTPSAASTRILSLLDANSFVEFGAQVTARSTDFNLSAKAAPSDGVITGYGTIDGSLVFVYSQDASVLGGSVGEMHAKKIVKLYQKAAKMGAPVIAMLDSTGVRLEESTDALNALGEIYNNQVLLSGVIPQIAIVCGNCGGGLSFIPALSDFVFMEEADAKLYVNTPDAIIGNSADLTDNRTASYQSETGNVDFVGSKEEIIAAVRSLVGILPFNNEDSGEVLPCADDLNRACTNISAFRGDAASMLAMIADNGYFFETKKKFAECIVTGFMRLNGQTVGAVANSGKKDTLCANGAAKAADFIRFCDAFNIPVLTLAIVKGYARKECQEKRLPKAAAALATAYAQATVPKVTVVVGAVYGSPYVLMGSKAIGADFVYAWPDSEIGMMDAKQAAKLLVGGDNAADVRKTAAEYAALQQNVVSAAQRGYVDTIIDEADTRKYVIGAFEMLYTKREDRPSKKHGTI